MKRCYYILCMMASLLFVNVGEAHKLSDSYLSLSLAEQGNLFNGQWDIALRDLDYALTLDVNHDGQITWGELRQAQTRIWQYATARLTLEAIARGDREPCAMALQQLQVDEHVDGHYAVLQFTANCSIQPAQLAVHYSLLFDIDPTHRGLLQISAGGASQAAVLPREAPMVAINLSSPNRWQQFREFVNEGIWHIWKGYDHILFLLTLLFPAVLVYRHRQWHARGARAATIDVVKVVTAFTVAHSLTLTLAVLGLVHLPSRLVESAIAATVLLGALNNLFPIVRERRWLVAFVFGMVHGLGFASVLADLGLHGWNLLLALVGFNAGVEMGQLVIVMVFLPVAIRLRDTGFYRRIFMPSGGVTISIIAAYWLFSRMTGTGN